MAESRTVIQPKVQLEIHGVFNGEFGVLQKVIATEQYTGETEVTPTFEQQILYTKGKSMPKNVTVDAISVSKVSNLSGGNTVYIGGTING